MVRKVSRLALVGFLLVAACRPTSTGLVNQAVAARGGLERLKAIHSARLSGRISFGSVEGSLAVDFKRPDQMRIQIVLPTRTVVRLLDGSSGWVSSGASGRRQFERMSTVELSRARREADLDGPLVDALAKGVRIEVAGKGAVEGRATDQLDIVFPDGTVQRYELDAASHEPVRWAETEPVDGKPREVATTVRATRRVDGVLFPTTIETGPPGGTPSQRIIIEHIELNPALDDAWFRPPAAG